MGATASVLTGLQTAYSFLGQQKQANALRAQGKYQQAADNADATLADQQAADAIERGGMAANRVHADTLQTIGSTRASLAGQGVDVTAGSAKDVQASEAGLGALDEVTVRNNAAREAWGYTTEGIQRRKAGELAAAGANNEADAVRQQSYSTLIAGGLNTYGIYSQYKRLKGDERTGPYRTGKP